MLVALLMPKSPSNLSGDFQVGVKLTNLPRASAFPASWYSSAVSKAANSRCRNADQVREQACELVFLELVEVNARKVGASQ